MQKDTQFRVALFDLDGVVFDTEPQYTVFWGGQCRLYHPEHPRLEHEIKGQTLQQIYDKWFSGPLEAEQTIITDRLNRFEQEMDFVYVDGFREFISDLKQHGVKTAVVTSSNKAKMNSVYKKQPEFTQLFDAILTSEDFAESKPSPDCYQKGAARFGADPKRCIVFEDSFNGLKAGRAAGMMVVGLATTNSPESIAPLSDIQIDNFKNTSYNKLNTLLCQVI